MTTYPNWFDGQKYNFETHLLDLQGKPDLQFLQIGAYTGDASIWLCQNVLNSKTSWLYDVDTWTGSDESEHSQIDFEKVFEYYKERTALKATKHFRMTSDEYFANTKDIQFDFIYIDGDHVAEQVAKDAENAWKVLKPKGIMAFDDYMWGQDLPPHLTPRPAIDAFLEKHKGKYDLLTKEYQAWIQKNDN
jgi:SAM-dependent methyltransferase